MFILLSLILTTIAISLRLTASSLELANMVASRFTKNKNVTEVAKIPNGIVKVGVATSILSIRVIAFIVSRIRDLVTFIGSFVVLLDVIILIVVIVCSSASLVLFTSADVDGSLILNNASHRISASNKEKGKVSTEDTSKPEGITSESWNKADSVGKNIVTFACSSIFNPPNGTPLIYKQGNTPVGYADCSVFVCAVFEGSLKKTFGGIDAPSGYDFSKNRKSDLKGYVTTYGMEDVLKSKPQALIGTTKSSMDYANPGDVLLTDGHVGIYVGKNDKGQDIMVHASTNIDASCSDSINLEGTNNLHVGFSVVYGNYNIIRPSILLGN